MGELFWRFEVYLGRCDFVETDYKGLGHYLEEGRKGGMGGEIT